MNFCKHFKSFFILFLINFLISLSFFVCCLYSFDKNNSFYSIFFICLASLLSVNFIIFVLFTRLIENKKKIKKLEIDFEDKINDCFFKISNSYNLAEVSKISLGIFHDLSNIITVSNLALNEIFVNSNNLELKCLIEKVLNMNNKANCLLKSFKRQCQKINHKDNFCLSAEIRNILEIFNFYFIKFNIKLNLELDDEIIFFGDLIKFDQVIINLINNAIESFDDTIVDRRIFIKLSKFDNNIQLIIKDSGSGISPDDLPNIFKPFFSSKNNSYDKHCGVGLSLIKKIVEDDFLGSINVKSFLGKGTEFIVFCHYKHGQGAIFDI